LAEQGVRDESSFYFVDFAPGVSVDEDGFYHFCRSKLFHGERNGERFSLLISPTTKLYLPYTPRVYGIIWTDMNRPHIGADTESV